MSLTTASDRDPFIDFLRVTCVAVVVLGHWIVTTVFWEPGSIEDANALSHIEWLHLTTWIVQVMPLLFFVGGFSNARALEHRGDWATYLVDRYGRLLRPTLVMFATWLAIGIALDVLDPPQPNVLIEAADVSALPVWFLGIYIAVVALAPAMLRLHRRFGLLVPAALAIAVAVVDVIVHPFEVEAVGMLNYAFVWLFAHQLGFRYADRPEVAPRRAAGLALVGLAGLIALTGALDYPVSMVGVPGDARWNTSPPSLALVALTLWLVGLAFLGRHAIPIRVGGLVHRANRRVLTWYLWHVSALPIAVIVLLPLGFPQTEIGSGTWWVWRPLWVAALAAGLSLLTIAFGRFEIHPRAADGIGTSPLNAVAAGLAVFALAAGVLGFGVTGFTEMGVASDLEGFAVSPLLNAANLLLGVVLLGVIRNSWSAAVPYAIAATYTAFGSWVLVTGYAPLGTNEATSWALLAVGGVTLALLAAASRRTEAEGR